MKESQIIEWLIELAEKEYNRRQPTATDYIVFNSRVETARKIKDKLKRIDYFGGVETLIAKASTATKNEVLFPNND